MFYVSYIDVTIGCHVSCIVIVNVLATEQSKYVPLNFFPTSKVDGICIIMWWAVRLRVAAMKG